jgi:propionyl-CoA synthetase
VADRDRLDHRRQSDGAGLLPIKHGSPAVPMPGYDVQVIDDAGHPVRPEPWAILSSSCRCRRAVCRPFGTPRAVSRCLSAEFPGYYKTADAGFIDDDGYLFIMARTDDIINVAGHRLSTGGMEERYRAIRMWPNARSSALPTR